jgi:hypothetical protein
MIIRQWLKETVWQALKKAWQRSCEKSRENTKSRLSRHNDLTNPEHPLNVGQREMNDYNNRRTHESLRYYLQTTQRLQEYQRHHHVDWDRYLH